MVQPVFRFAPSPNGELHLGHAFSALLNARMAEEAGGRFLVRIEDTDVTRCTAALTAGVLEDLSWLGLRWEEPVRRQSEHFADYDTNLTKLWRMGMLYPCFCSRKTANAEALTTRDPDGQRHYGGACRALPRAHAESQIAAGEQHGWRLDMKACNDPAAAHWGDMMIAKKGVGSYYHIAVVTDDHLQGITHVVRGKDIEAATPLHQLLQRLLGFDSPHYHHHELIRDESGQKLSKSLKSASLKALRGDGVRPEAVRRRLGFA